MKTFRVESATIIKNRTHWFGIGDFVQVLCHEIFGAIDRTSLDMAKAIRAGIHEKGEVFVVVHSQGSGYFKQGLSLLSVEERSRINVLTVGAQWIIDSGTEGLASAENVWNKGDFVPMLGNRLRVISNVLFPWNWGRSSERDLVKSDAGTRWGLESHYFANYEEAVYKWMKKMQRRWVDGTIQPAY
jgi:hypothetical protein